LLYPIRTPEALAAARQQWRASGHTVGLVPTMGYLHAGHMALVRRARAECDIVLTSIYVNPTQFGPHEDFATYPRDLDRDLALLERERCDAVFAPEQFYPPDADTFVVPGAIATPLEGERRPGHFRGVATVVAMLFNAVQPDRAYFGEKDWQQLQVVRRMVRDLHMSVKLVGVPTVREADGLAMSSRNVRLNPADRSAALCLSRALAAAQDAYAAGERRPAALERAMFDVVARERSAELDYAVVRDSHSLLPVDRADDRSRLLIAARVGRVRLIDNAAMRP
jgi:pantoate--beta-alanine ligase